jgi:hypothetical protein
MRLVTLVAVLAAPVLWTAAGLAPPAAAAQAEPAPTAPTPEGLWQGVIAYDPGKVEIDIVVELGQAPDGRWAGTIDVLPLGIEYYPLEDVSVEGSQVTFWLNRRSPTAGLVESPFRGELSADGSTIAGEFVEGGKNHHPFEIERIGEAGDPRPEPVLSEVQPLSGNLGELRDAFNRHRDAVRVVMLLSPT